MSSGNSHDERSAARVQELEAALRVAKAVLLDVSAVCSQREDVEVALTTAGVPLNEAIETTLAVFR